MMGREPKRGNYYVQGKIGMVAKPLVLLCLTRGSLLGTIKISRLLMRNL